MDNASSVADVAESQISDILTMLMMRLEILMRYQDDPKKCTAAKLVRCGLARRVRRMPARGLVLNPYGNRLLLPADRDAAALVGIDCSWRLARREFAIGDSGNLRLGRMQHDVHARSLPPLLAGNPVNYAKTGILTTAEAMAASMFIMGMDGRGHELLDMFGWGHTFYDLNCNILGEYAQMAGPEDAARIAADYGLPQSHF